MEPAEEGGPRRRLSPRRLEAFSDGVFAIAITLLVLEISVPEDAGDDLLHAFLAQWPSYLAYAVSFATIGAVWLSHSAITEYVREVDTVFVRLNLLLLMLVSFVPFPTRLLAGYIGDDGPERVAATVYGLTLLAVGLMLLPAVAARFWARDLGGLIPVSMLIAATASISGLSLSYHFDLPSGPAIVLAAGALYVASMMVGPRGGLLRRLVRTRHLEA